jgi:hypothetical protein
MLNGRRLRTVLTIDRDAKPTLSLFGISAAVALAVVVTMAVKTPNIQAGV